MTVLAPPFARGPGRAQPGDRSGQPPGGSARPTSQDGSHRCRTVTAIIDAVSAGEPKVWRLRCPHISSSHFDPQQSSACSDLVSRYALDIRLAG